jgi:hypothetical protein
MAAIRRRVLSLAATGCIPEHWPAPESAPASGRRILESSRSPHHNASLQPVDEAEAVLMYRQ